jgi:hypothetical protein
MTDALHGKCTKSSAPIVESKPKCHSNLMDRDQYIAGTAIKSIAHHDIKNPAKAT